MSKGPPQTQQNEASKTYPQEGGQGEYGAGNGNGVSATVSLCGEDERAEEEGQGDHGATRRRAHCSGAAEAAGDAAIKAATEAATEAPRPGPVDIRERCSQ